MKRKEAPTSNKLIQVIIIGEREKNTYIENYSKKVEKECFSLNALNTLAQWLTMLSQIERDNLKDREKKKHSKKCILFGKM